MRLTYTLLFASFFTFYSILYALSLCCFFFFFFNDTATTEIYTLSLHDALPISEGPRPRAGDGWGDRRLARLETPRRCVNEEVSMDEHRRDFLKQMTTLPAAGMPIVTVAEPLLARAGEAQRRSGMKTSYEPAAMFEL